LKEILFISLTFWVLNTMNKIHKTFYSWRYKYDNKKRIWRAFRNTIEVNQFHVHELHFVMEHLDDPMELPNLVLARVPVLSSEERQKFLTEVAEETGYDSNSEEC